MNCQGSKKDKSEPISIRFKVASLKEGDTVFVHASASGVGTSLIQLAKLKNAKVIASASTNQKLEFVKNLGADLTGRT